MAAAIDPNHPASFRRFESKSFSTQGAAGKAHEATRAAKSRCFRQPLEECVVENVSLTIRKNRVRELRENRLITQSQLACKAKIAIRTIRNVEKGMNCRMDTKRKILLALGLRFEDKDHVFPPVHPRTRVTAPPNAA